MAAIPLQLLKNPSVLFATGFGSGLSPKMPGTLGSAVSLLLFFVLSDTGWPLLILCVAGFVAGVWFCDQTSKILGVHDHGGIVWDEFIGMWITMLWVPITTGYLILAFILFRLFDIFKPWPIGPLDKRVHGGFGIMIDDVVAGIFANICLQIVLFIVGF